MERKLFQEEHHLLRKTLGEFIEQKVLPEYPKWEKEGLVPKKMWLDATAEFCQGRRRGAADRRIGLWRLRALAVGGRGRVDARPPPLRRRCDVEVAARAGADARLEVVERSELGS